MTRRPLCILCLVLMLFLCVADRAGLPLIRGNPVPENTASWIEKHPQATICGEVVQSTESEFSQAVYLRNTYLIYQPKKNQSLKKQSINAQSKNEQSEENPSQKIQSKKISIENVKVFLKRKEKVPVGTVVLVSGKLERVEEKRNPGEFDSQQYYACQHIFYFMKKAEILEKSERYSAYGEGISEVREYLAGVLGKIAGEEAGIFQAIVLGDKSSLDKEIKLRYQMTGIVHVLAISGLHISVLGMGLYSLLMKTGLGIWLSGLFSLLVLLQYGMMTGGSVSTMRAVCMFLISIGAKITGRIYDLPTALAVSAVMMLGDSGAYLYSSGFLLSFSAVVGAGVVVPALTKRMEESARKIPSQRNGKARPGRSRIPRRGKKTFGNKACAALMASLGIQLTMLPVSFYFFGEVSLIGIVLNLLVLPTVGVVLGSGVVALLTGCVNLKLGSVMILPGRFLAKVYGKLCELAGNLPFCTWIPGQPKLWQVGIYYILLFGTIRGLTYKKSVDLRGDSRNHLKKYFKNHFSNCARVRLHSDKGKINNEIATRLVALIGISIALMILCWRGQASFSITCLDVGQGDGIVVQTPEGHCFLVDGGSSSKNGTGQYQILPYLKSQRISRIDGIFISHTDKDHISGIQEILELTAKKLNSVKIGCLYLPKWEKPPDEWENLKRLAETAGIPVEILKEGDCLKAGKLQIKIVAPLIRASGMDVNEDGMVLQVKYKNFIGLLTGDIGEETEKKLLTQGKLEDVDFLKVGHHGSHYSTSWQFLEKVRPEYAFISCSETNTYGHPSPETIERLDAAGCQVEFTMKSGAIKVILNAGKIEVERYLK